MKETNKFVVSEVRLEPIGVQIRNYKDDRWTIHKAGKFLYKTGTDSYKWDKFPNSQFYTLEEAKQILSTMYLIEGMEENVN